MLHLAPEADPLALVGDTGLQREARAVWRVRRQGGGQTLGLTVDLVMAQRPQARDRGRAPLELIGSDLAGAPDQAQHEVGQRRQRRHLTRLLRNSSVDTVAIEPFWRNYEHRNDGSSG